MIKLGSGTHRGILSSLLLLAVVALAMLAAVATAHGDHNHGRAVELSVSQPVLQAPTTIVSAVEISNIINCF
jgi:hypothetical protein